MLYVFVGSDPSPRKREKIIIGASDLIPSLMSRHES